MASTQTYNNPNLPKTHYGIIYIIANTECKRVYIGKTCYTLSERWKAHLEFGRKVRQLRERNPERNYIVSPLIKAIATYDEKVWRCKVLDFANTKEELYKLEDEYIKRFKSTNYLKGYNMKRKFSKEADSMEDFFYKKQFEVLFEE